MLTKHRYLLAYIKCKYSMYMKSPWNNIDSAFDPMFDEEIVVKFKRDGEPCSQTMRVYVTTGITSDTLSEDIMDSQSQVISIVSRQEDYAFFMKLKRGDVIVRPMCLNKIYTVEEVKYDELMHLIAIAKSSKKSKPE